MRFLIDECVGRQIVERLRADAHDVLWIAEIRRGEADADILDESLHESRILLTEDWDFGELAIRFSRPALGIVIVAMPQLAHRIDAMVENLVQRLAELDQTLIGKLTIMEAGRVRQRDLTIPDNAEQEF